MKQSPAIPLVDRLAALSDTTRLRLLRLLDQHELSVGEIGKVVQLPQSTVSRHLKVLADAGWVARRSEGTASFFRLVQDDLSPSDRSLWLSVRDGLDPSHESREDDQRVHAVLAERRTDSLAFFGRVSGDWDALRAELFGSRFTSAALAGLLPSSWVVADLGCGTGSISEVLAPFVRSVHAVDASASMLDAARRRLHACTNVTLVQAQADATGLPGASVDAVLCVLVLHHTDAPARVMAEAARLLRPAGTLLIVDMIAHERDDYVRTMGHKHRGFSRSQMKQMILDAGLVDGVYHELPRETDAKGPGLFVAKARVAPSPH
jgi:SAM-dependent methyltransferase